MSDLKSPGGQSHRRRSLPPQGASTGHLLQEGAVPEAGRSTARAGPQELLQNHTRTKLSDLHRAQGGGVMEGNSQDPPGQAGERQVDVQGDPQGCSRISKQRSGRAAQRTGKAAPSRGADTHRPARRLTGNGWCVYGCPGDARKAGWGHRGCRPAQEHKQNTTAGLEKHSRVGGAGGNRGHGVETGGAPSGRQSPHGCPGEKRPERQAWRSGWGAEAKAPPGKAPPLASAQRWSQGQALLPPGGHTVSVPGPRATLRLSRGKSPVPGLQPRPWLCQAPTGSPARAQGPSFNQKGQPTARGSARREHLSQDIGQLACAPPHGFGPGSARLRGGLSAPCMPPRAGVLCCAAASATATWPPHRQQSGPRP